MQNVPFDPAQFREANEPPPLSVFLLLDREIPANSQNLSRDNVPKVLGEMLLYGKETDRPARVEFSAVKSADFEAKLKHLGDSLGQWAGEKLGEEETGRISAVAAALSINWRFPDDTPLDVRKRLMQEQRTLSLLSIWPNLPMGVLDGKTPRQAVADPAGQIRVQATILQMDLAEPVENPDYNKLRRSLGLATLEPIDPAGVRVELLSPARQTRLELNKTTDEQLVAVYRRAVVTAAPRLLRNIGLEIVSRPSLDSHATSIRPRSTTFSPAWPSMPTRPWAISSRRRKSPRPRGTSPARYLLAELPYRLQRGEEQEGRRILNLLTTRPRQRARCAGVAAELAGAARFGAGGSGDRPADHHDALRRRPRVPPTALGAAPPPPTAAPAPQSALWTPDQLAPGPARRKQKQTVDTGDGLNQNDASDK